MEQLSLKLLDSMDAGFVLYEMVTDDEGNQDMKVLFANEFYATLIGFTPETVIGQLFSTFCAKDIAWVPMFADVAFGKKEAYSFESYTVAYNFYAHSQLFHQNTDRPH